MDISNKMELTEEMTRIRKIIQRKQRDLHTMNSDLNFEQTKKLKPIIDPIQKLSDQIGQNSQIQENQAETKVEAKVETEIKKEPNLWIFYRNKLAQRSKEIDMNRSGPRIEGSNIFLGRSKMSLKNDNIVIDGIEYTESPGLYNLIFLKKPDSFTAFDKEQYINISNQTNLFRSQYEPDGKINTISYKYSNIIKPIKTRDSRDRKIAKPKMYGGDLLDLNSSSTNFVYWDCPNELVQRLAILFASKNAGNNSHNNEILRIEEELREAGYIK